MWSLIIFEAALRVFPTHLFCFAAGARLFLTKRELTLELRTVPHHCHLHASEKAAKHFGGIEHHEIFQSRLDYPS